MALTAVGRISMQNVVCPQCGCSISTWKWNTEDTLTCFECGATYQKTDSEIKSDEVHTTYNFVEFRCLCHPSTGPCKNACPAGGMYCREHVTDEEFKRINDSIKYNQDRIADFEKVLNRLIESKKTWLILELGGLSESKE